MPELHKTRRVLVRARSRLTFNAWLRALGWSLLVAAAVATLLLAAVRLLSLALSPWVYLGLILAALIVSVGVAVFHRPTLAQTADHLDARLGLKNRLGSAWFTWRQEGSNADESFSGHLMQEAEREAQGVRLGRAAPLRLTPVWGWTPVLLGGGALLAVFLPPMDLAGLRAQEQDDRRQQAEAQQSEQAVEEAVTVLQQLQGESQEDEASGSGEGLDEAMRELQGLSEQDLSTPESRQGLAARLSELDERLGAAQEQQETTFDQIRNMLSSLEPEGSGPADAFADALRRGDFKAAADALDQLGESAEGLSEAERSALDQQLESMKRQLQQMAEQQQARAEQAQRDAKQQLQDQGLSEQQAERITQRMASGQMSPQQAQQAIQQALQQQNPQASPQQVQKQGQQAAQQLQQTLRKGGACQSASQTAQQLAQQMQQMQGSPNGQPSSQGQGQPSGGQGAQPGSSGSQALQQLAQMQQAMSQTQQARQQTQQAMQQLAGGGSGGKQWGTGDGGNPFGPERNRLNNFNVRRESDARPGDENGPVIASWISRGPVEEGEVQREYSESVREARSSAERAVSEQRVPRRFHEGIKSYFNQLPEDLREVESSPEAPAAPR